MEIAVVAVVAVIIVIFLGDWKTRLSEEITTRANSVINSHMVLNSGCQN